MNKVTITILLAAGLLAAALPRAFADEPIAGPAATTRPGPEDPVREFANMVIERAVVPAPAPTAAAKKAPPLPADGSRTYDQRCRLMLNANNGWLEAHFIATGDKEAPPPMKLLPCFYLQQMETLTGKDNSVTFRVSGENTVYKGEAYLLLTKLTVVEQEDTGRPTAAAKLTEPQVEAAVVPATADTQPSAMPSSDDIMKRMTRENIGKPVLTPVEDEPVKPAPSVAPKDSDTAVPLRQRKVIDRVVRIVHEKHGWHTAHFEADNTLGEPPVLLLPCKNLEQAQALGAGSGNAVRFRISGEIATYKGAKYLLLRKVLVEKDMGQF